jgi:uncharacterized protein YjiS (DUF1127 family)
MSRLTDLNQALRRQSTRTTWMADLAAPAGAFGQPLQRTDTPRQSPGASGLLSALVQSIVRAVRRHRTVRMLRQLDAHLLADIGIERGEIDKVAAKAAKATRPVVAAGPAQWVGAELVAALRKSWRRQTAIRSLQSLPDWALADIGIERGRIPASVDHLLAQAKQSPAARPGPAVAPKPVEAAAPAHRAAA